MDWSKFKDRFHPSWHDKMKPFVESKECDKIFEFIKKESKRGKAIAPASMHLWRAFMETSLDDLKVVLVGLSPYHTLKNGSPIADGLLMGCSITQQIQPTLDQFYDALETEFYDGLNLNMIKDSDVSYLAKQGVLMLNAALTTEINKAGSHLDIWEPFMRYLFDEIINPTGVPIVFLGKDAGKYDNYTGLFTHTFVISHPASASYKGTKWDSEGVFKKVSKIIKENNNFEIDWIQTNAPF